MKTKIPIFRHCCYVVASITEFSVLASERYKVAKERSGKGDRLESSFSTAMMYHSFLLFFCVSL